MLVSTFMYNMALNGTKKVSENDISTVQVHSSTCGSNIEKSITISTATSMRSLNFSIDLILPAALWPRVDSAFNRHEYQEFSWRIKGRPAHKADNLTPICEPTV
jgi:hypothetical protein